MKEIEQLIYGRMTADTAATVGLVALLGAATQIAHAFQLTIPPVPYLTFQVFSGGKGMATGDFARSLDYFIAFNAFASNYADILLELGIFLMGIVLMFRALIPRSGACGAYSILKVRTDLMKYWKLKRNRCDT